MWNKPSVKRLAKIPPLYSQDGISIGEKKVYLHFFLGSCDWWILEYDQKDTFFGIAMLNGDKQNAEFGYVSFKELQDIKMKFGEIDCELAKYWKTPKIKDIPGLNFFVEKFSF